MRNFISCCIFFIVVVIFSGCGAPLDITKEKNSETILWGNLEVIDSDCDNVFAQTLEEACRDQKEDVSFSDCMTNIIQKCAVNPEDLSEGFWKDCFDSEMSLKGPRSKIYFGDCDDSDSAVGLTGSETRSCVEGLEIGTETRTCTMGVWEDWSDVECIFCTDGQSQSEECGLNGRGSMTRICIEGVWSEYSECNDPDECVDETTQDLTCGLNGRGVNTQTCTEGSWVDGTCNDPDECVDETTQDLTCGLNGRGVNTQTCTEGSWVDGTCNDPDECVDETTQVFACGLNGRGTQTDVCTEGSWVIGVCVDDDACTDDETRVLTCGLNGRGSQTDTCVAGVWEDGTCNDPDECVDDETVETVCGLNDRGLITDVCTEGSWVYGTCVDPDTCVDGETNEIVCGLNGRGVQTQLCVEGTLSDPSECVDPDHCVDGSTTQDDNADYVSCQEGSWGLIDCSVEDHCWEYAGSFGFVETIFDTGVSCVEDTDCENSVCEAGTCIRIFDHLDGENFGCLPSGVCGTCDDADADGICGGGSTGPETCESSSDCLSGQVCTPQGQCINYPDPSVTCFPFQVVLPADTNASMIYVWNEDGQLVSGAPQALPEAVEGFITINSTDYEGACGMTFEYEGRWQSYLDETFPEGAPQGDAFFTFYEPGQLCQVGGNAAWGISHDKTCIE